MADSPFAAPTADGEVARDLPGPMDLVSKTIAEVQKDFVPFLLAGVIPGLGIVMVSVLAVFVVYAGMFVGMLPGMATGSDELVFAGMFGGLFLGIFGLVLVVTGLTLPIVASLWRAIWAYLTTGEKLTLTSGFATATQDLPLVYGYALLAGLAVVAGLCFCYLPGLIVSEMLVWGFPSVVIHRMAPGAAMSRSVRHAMDNPTWHLGFFAVNFVMSMVLSYLPLVGTMLVLTIQPLFVLLAYRAIFGDEAPATEG